MNRTALAMPNVNLKPKVINHRASRTAEQLYFLFQNAYRQEARWLGEAAKRYFLPMQRDAAAIRLAPSRMLGLESQAGEVQAVIELVEPVPEQPWCEIVGLCVAPAAQRKGFAARLLQVALDTYGAKGTALRVSVAEGNAPAQALYERFQFKPVGREKKHGVTLLLLERSA
ncbi:GNAT family N-acetyltransferase [Simiduia sp. 21SJ11W-1]|uniref:GNAT family N-acetyltransferase n=1 Tax=Simiduia sp. 21SJ11W-1 TaxID=2909669 RepID=UPI00209E872C|nr:GNAT family N-acetyltransferase [Simiduia sp. 21SJ11W-1]UTA48991.1 GNAT family N-acetyltransferase [Simiduia sp. 21SJ11W-1]